MRSFSGIAFVPALVLGAAALQSCASAPPPAPAGGFYNEGASAQPGAVAGSSGPSSGPSTGAAGPPIPNADIVDTASLERSGLKTIDTLSVRLSHADIMIATGADYRKGLLKIDKIEGDPACKVRIRLEGERLALTEAPGSPSAFGPSGHASPWAPSRSRSSVPDAGSCRYIVTIGLREAAPADIELVRGSISGEQWPEPIKVRLTWGDVDVGSVGPLDVSCGRCTLSGENVEGGVHYNMESGNVGIAGLTGGVEGQTLGDTVLKWRRLKPDSAVRVVSRAGDVILFFPEAAPLAVDLHAPRGDVSSRFEPGMRGVPVSVTAELGNVQVYRAGASGAGPVRKAARRN